MRFGFPRCGGTAARRELLLTGPFAGNRILVRVHDNSKYKKRDQVSLDASSGKFSSPGVLVFDSHPTVAASRGSLAKSPFPPSATYYPPTRLEQVREADRVEELCELM